MTGPTPPTVGSDGPAAPPAGGERGTALVGSAAGAVVFLVFLLLVTQLAVNLYTTSVVSAVGLDAARAVAAGAVDHADGSAVRAAEARAEARARGLLGRAGGRARFTWAVDTERVRLRLRLAPARFLPAGLDQRVGFDAIDRTITVRVERFR